MINCNRVNNGFIATFLNDQAKSAVIVLLDSRGKDKGVAIKLKFSIQFWNILHSILEYSIVLTIKGISTFIIWHSRVCGNILKYAEQPNTSVPFFFFRIAFNLTLH